MGCDPYTLANVSDMNNDIQKQLLIKEISRGTASWRASDEHYNPPPLKSNLPLEGQRRKRKNGSPTRSEVFRLAVLVLITIIAVSYCFMVPSRPFGSSLGLGHLFSPNTPTLPYLETPEQEHHLV